jgi:hypothetical protein
MGRSTQAHTGASSCQLCPDGNVGFFTIDPGDVQLGARVGERYEISVWLRLANTAGPSVEANLAVRVWDSGGHFLENVQDQSFAVDGTWQRHSFAHTLEKAGTMNAYVSFERNGAACVLVDDLAIVRLE